jgi:hypothetical protein
MDNINNTIYTMLAQHTSIHTSTFYLITILNSDATIKLKPEKLREERGEHHITPNSQQF